MPLIDIVCQEGIVGCGGAGYPTHMKLKANADYFIVNGLECEPLLRTDRYLMKHHAEDLVLALDAIEEELTPGKIVIGLKAAYQDEMDALQAAIRGFDSKVQLYQVGNFYPAGDEQILTRVIAGRTVPPRGIPYQVGVIVSNVGTIYQVSQAIQGKPFITKHLTVTGEVENPMILEVPIGISYRECIERAKPKNDSFCVIEGGPIMGKIVGDEKSLNGVVTKTTSGLILVKKDGVLARRRDVSIGKMIAVAKSVCMQCSACTAMCPRYQSGHPLRPHKIMRALNGGRNVEDYVQNREVKQALICSECGVCEMYACPMGISPRRINQFLKGSLQKSGVQYENLPDLGGEERFHTYDGVPSKRIAARTGVLEYYHYRIERKEVMDARMVSIPLKQHVGVPAEATVTVGQQVQAGDVIGEIPKGKLGARVHASISGKVKEIHHSVIIEKE